MWLGNLSSQEKTLLEDVLSKGLYMQIASMYQDEPYLIALHYAWDGQHVYLHGARQGRKTRAFAKPVHVVFQVVEGAALIPADTPCDWATRFYSVGGRGTLFPLKDGDKLEALDLITRKYTGEESRGYPQAMLDNTMVWKIDVCSLSGRIAKYPLESKE